MRVLPPLAAISRYERSCLLKSFHSDGFPEVGMRFSCFFRVSVVDVESVRLSTLFEGVRVPPVSYAGLDTSSG